MSRCCRGIKEELRLKNIGFGNVHFARFIYSQWHLPPSVVLLYRFIFAAVTVGWLLYNATLANSLKINGIDVPVFAFLTEWTFFILALYFTLHFVVCLLYSCRRWGSWCTRPTAETHRALFNELDVFPSLWSSQEYQSIPGAVMDPDDPSSDPSVLVSQVDSLPWLLKLVWVIYNMASTASLMVTLVFWTLLYPQMDLKGLAFVINFMLHATNSIVIIFEHILSAVPFRFMHIIYPLIYAIIYVIFSGVYYAIDHRHVLYPNVLDWSQPGRTTVVLLIVAFIIFPLIQLFFCGIYRLRLFIYDKLHPEQL